VAERVEGWDAEAATGRAVIAYGAGYAGSWDAGSCCGLAQRGHVDDISYLRQLVGREEARQPIDRRRVYVVGFSNGGMLALAFACTHSELVSAVATVGASLQLPSCRPTRAVSVLDVAGGRDRVVPYAGSSYSPFAGAPTTSVPASMSPWRAVDAGTREAVVVVRLPRLGHDWPTRATAGWDGTTHLWWFLRVHARPTW
jgi:polyhydroxybutyrate depolymerase